MFGIGQFAEVLELTDPTLPSDVLASKQFLTLLDLLGEGEIEGFPSAAGLTKGTTAYNNAALKDVFLNGTQILQTTADNSNPIDTDFNFPNITFTPRFGTSSQEPIQGIVASESETAVNTAVTKDSPVNRTITNTEIDAVRVTLGFPQLQTFTDDGDIEGAEVAINIQTIENDGTTTTVITDVVKGKASNMYFRDYKINFPSNTSFPVTIRVNRTTDDSTETTLQNSSTWSSFTEIINEQKAYLNSAYIALRIDAQTFPSVPRRMYKIRGTKIKIPHNGTVQSDGSISYSGTFNGTFKTDKEWTNDPAWVLYDLLTTSKGFGDHIDSTQLDVFSFYSASVYCSEQVDNGIDGTEPRFSCNVVIQNQKQAYDLINDLCSVMRVMPFYSAGTISITQDRPTDPSYLFSLANVGEGGFSYSGSSLKQRHSIISVSYFNMDSREIDYEVVGDDVDGPNALQEDIDRQAKLGIVKKDIRAFACTSRGQARRLGKAVLLSEEQETEVVSFTTSIDAGAIVRPGSVISVNDPVRAGKRRSGRIKAVSIDKKEITVDNTTDLNTFTGTNKKCSVILPDGTVETKNVNGIIGSVITLDSALSATPNINALWLLQSSTLEAHTFRVISVEEQDGINYAITALSYNYNYATGVSPKYAAIDSMQGITLPARNVSLLNEPKDPPANLQASEKIVVINALAVPKIIVSWVSVTGVNQYLVQYRFNNTNWVSENVFRPDFELLNTEAGTYEFKVFSYNAGLKLSATSSNLSFNAVGKSNPPGNVQNLSVEPITNKLVRLRWARAVDPDVLHGGRVYVRHSNLTDGTGTFQNSVDLVSALSGNTTDAIVPFLEGEYILKFQDDQGNFSLGETSIIIDLPDLIDTQTILTQREDLLSPPFNNTNSSLFTNTTFDSTASALRLSNPATNSTGEYEFASIVDLGGVFSLDLTRKLQAVGFNIGNNIETLIPSGNFWDDYATDGNFDGPAADEVDCQIQVATSQTASGSFGAFNNFANGNFKGRRFKFKLLLEATNTAQNINVQQAGFTALFQSRTEQNYQTGSGTSTAPQQSGTSSSGKTVTFGTPFFVGTSSLGGANAFLPIVGITIQNAQSGDFFTVTNVSGTQFTVSIKNGSSFVDRSFTFSAVGYGKGV